MNLIINNCNPKFAAMVQQIYRVYSAKIKCGIKINLSGNDEDFRFQYESIPADQLYKIIINGDLDGQTNATTKKP